MNSRVTEFHCIMPLENIPSVLKHGILSNEGAGRLAHQSVAMQVVQERRDLKHVPGGLKLHQYANLYFHARNPMMFKRRDAAATLCVLRVSTEVRHTEGVVFADCNASSDYVRFLHPKQADLLDYEAIFAMDWRHPNNPIAYYRHRSLKCAEVLVPHCVEPGFLTGAYVVDEAAAATLRSVASSLPVTINAEMFFR
jgi:hypothetical protein